MRVTRQELKTGWVLEVAGERERREMGMMPGLWDKVGLAVLTLQWWALEEGNSKKERNHSLVVNSCNQGSLSTHSIPELPSVTGAQGGRLSLCPQRSSRGIGYRRQVHKHMGAIRFLCSGPPGAQGRGSQPR